MKKSEVPRHQSAKAPKLIFFCKNIELYQELQALTRKSTIGLYLHLHSICTHTQNYTLKCIYSLSANIIYFCTCEHNWVREKIECNLHFFMRIANIRLNSIFCTKKSILVLLHFGALAPLTFSWRHPMPENNNKKRK